MSTGPAPQPPAALPAVGVERVLCVLQPTRIHPGWERRIAGKPVGQFDFRRLGRLQQALLWKSQMQYLRAAPRGTTYMLSLALDLLSKQAPGAQIDLLLDPALTVPEHLRGAFHRIWVGPEGLASLPPDFVTAQQQSRPDALILLYPDAIGTGWERTERLLARLGIPHRLVINGRRRVFAWDEGVYRALRQRRLLANTFLPELVLAPTLVLSATLLALYDALRAALRRVRTMGQSA